MKRISQTWNWYRDSWQHKPLFNIFIATFALSAFFITMPMLDIWFSELFYVEGEGFPARKVELLLTIRAIGQYFPIAFAIVILVAIILKLIYPSRRCLFPARFTVYFGSLFLLGPGLLVNGILKPLWDRPRPVNTIDFGGVLPFVQAWTMGGDFFANRSFVSGETAGVICLLPLALFVAKEWRRSVMALLLAFAVIISVNRIAFGAHYLSDVLISAGLMFALSVGLWQLIFNEASGAISEEILEARLSRAGYSLHGRIRRLKAAFVRTGHSAWAWLGTARPGSTHKA